MQTSISNKIAQMRDTLLDKTWKKVTVAILLTAVIISGIGFTYIWFTPSLKSYFFDPKPTNLTNDANKVVLSETDLKLLEFNPTSLLIQKKTVKDLPIYPDAWKKEYFSESELKDESISGKNADPDRDGLINKEEYIYGSNPKNNDTLGAGGTDGEYVKAGRNPLSGLPLEDNNFSYYFLNSDIAILEEMNKNLDSLEDAGISIPKLYEQARQKDFSDETKDIALTIIDNPTREGSVDYLNQRLILIQDVVKSNYLNSLSKIYQVSKVEELQTLKNQNQGRISTLLAMGVPKQEVAIHKNLVYFFKQIDRLIDLRVEVIEKGLERKDYDQRQQEIVLRTVWAYRQINNAVNDLNSSI